METRRAPLPPAARSNSTLLIFVAVGLGLLAAVIHTVYLRSQDQARQQRSFKIYFLNANKAANSKLSENDLNTVLVPDTPEMKEALHGKLEAVIDSYMMDRIRSEKTLSRSAAQGELVTEKLFRTSDEGDKLMRLKLSDPSHVFKQFSTKSEKNGVLIPQKHVEIQVPIMDQGKPDIFTVMKNVTIQALDKQIDPVPVTNYRTFTIELTSDDARMMQLIQDRAIGNEFYLLVCDPNITPTPINPDLLEKLGIKAAPHR